MPEPSDLLAFVTVADVRAQICDLCRGVKRCAGLATGDTKRTAGGHDGECRNASAKHPFVAEFEPQHIEKLATMATRVRFDRDQIIFREGDECSEFYLIVTGLVALEIAAPGHTFRVQTLFAGDELGWSAMLMGRRKHFQARTLERVEAWRSKAGSCWLRARRTSIRLFRSCSGCWASWPGVCRRRGCRCWTCTRRWPSARERDRPVFLTLERRLR